MREEGREEGGHSDGGEEEQGGGGEREGEGEGSQRLQNAQLLVVVLTSALLKE